MAKIRNVNVEKRRKYGSNIGGVNIEITLQDSEGTRYSLDRTFRDVDTRRDVTRDYVENKVAKLLDGRDDTEGLEVVGIYAEARNRIWGTPYSDVYGDLLED